MNGLRVTAAASLLLTILFAVLGMTGDPLWLIGCLAEAAITGVLTADLIHNHVEHSTNPGQPYRGKDRTHDRH